MKISYQKADLLRNELFFKGRPFGFLMMKNLKNVISSITGQENLDFLFLMHIFVKNNI